MLEPWNDSSILPPPVHTFACDPNSIIDVKELTYTCNSMVKVLTKQSPLHKESAILSRLLYKFDKKFRNDIGYRNLRKVNTALRKYLVLNFFKDVDNFQSILPSSDDDEYLPTKQMLEYVLVRLITFSKLMMRVCVCSKQAAIFYLDRVKRGESHWMSLMPYALLSRVWSMTMVLLQYSCQWYSKLFPFLNRLQHKGMTFLPENYKLPSDLEVLLDMKSLDNYGRFQWSQKKQIEIDQSLIEDNEGDTFESILHYVNQVNESDEIVEENLEQTEKLKDNGQLQVLSAKTVDQGQVISRDLFKRNLVSLAPKSNHSIEGVTNRAALQRFVSMEEKFRNEENAGSLTNHLSFMQWQVLKNSLLKLLESLTSNRKIERKFQKLWKEKCLDYS